MRTLCSRLHESAANVNFHRNCQVSDPSNFCRIRARRGTCRNSYFKVQNCYSPLYQTFTLRGQSQFILSSKESRVTRLRSLSEVRYHLPRTFIDELRPVSEVPCWSRTQFKFHCDFSLYELLSVNLLSVLCQTEASRDSEKKVRYYE